MAAFLSVFLTVFVAEIGDKTQLATMLFAADDNHSKWVVFLAASIALVCAAGIGVIAGAGLQQLISPQTLQRIAGAGFCVMGLWMLLRPLQA